MFGYLPGHPLAQSSRHMTNHHHNCDKYVSMNTINSLKQRIQNILSKEIEATKKSHMDILELKNKIKMGPTVEWQEVTEEKIRKL